MPDRRLISGGEDGTISRVFRYIALSHTFSDTHKLSQSFGTGDGTSGDSVVFGPDAATGNLWMSLIALGWSREQIILVDDDLGISGDGTAERSGFSNMTAKAALGQVGIILGIEVSRLARNNAEWYRLLDLCAMTDTPHFRTPINYHSPSGLVMLRVAIA